MNKTRHLNDTPKNKYPKIKFTMFYANKQTLYLLYLYIMLSSKCLYVLFCYNIS